MNPADQSHESQELWAREMFATLTPAEPAWSEAELMYRAGEASALERLSEAQRREQTRGRWTSLLSAITGSVATWLVMTFVLSRDSMPVHAPQVDSQLAEATDSSPQPAASDSELDKRPAIAQTQVDGLPSQTPLSGRWAMMLRSLEGEQMRLPSSRGESESESAMGLERPVTPQFELRRQWLVELQGNVT